MKRSTRLTLLALLGSLLSACTGTEEKAPELRLALLLDGGQTLAYVTSTTPPSNTGGSKTPQLQGNRTLGENVGTDLQTLNGGRNLGLTRLSNIELLNVDLQKVQDFTALPFEPCLKQTVSSAARDRLLTLSDCGNDKQYVALYRADGTLVWRALLPVFTPPAQTVDTPPLRLGVLGDVGLVTRPALAGGSEVIRIAPRGTGDPVQDAIAVVSDPQRSESIRDIAPFGATLYAATDSGVRPLLPSGLPNAESTVAAFGTERTDRLWSGSTGTRSLLVAWRDNAPRGTWAEPLWVWDGVRTEPLKVDTLGNLRDLTIAPDGNMYVLSSDRLMRYDTVFGLSQGNWQGSSVISSLKDARAVAWLTPVEEQ